MAVPGEVKDKDKSEKYEDAPHCACISLRIDPATLKVIKTDGQTLSASMNAQIGNTLHSLVRIAKENITDD